MSQQEYLAALAAIDARRAAPSYPGEVTRADEEEFNLTVDYRLGRQFPFEKRKTMFRVHRKLCKMRDEALAALASGTLSPEAYALQLQVLIQDMAREYSRILSPTEIEAFLDVKPGETPVLPINPAHIGG
jgi:hypothetical protein